MHPKITLSTAWAEKLGFSDEDICKLFDIDPSSALVTKTDEFACPKCGNSSEDSNFVFYVYLPSDSPTICSGLQYAGCVCGSTYVGRFTRKTIFCQQDEVPEA